MIYTSYYAKINTLPNDIEHIAISIGVPNWYTGKTYKKLAPTWELVRKWKNGMTELEYINEYIKILNNLNPHDVVHDLISMSDTMDVVLLCYEKTGDFCHRHIVSNWLSQAGYNVMEWRG